LRIVERRMLDYGTKVVDSKGGNTRVEPMIRGLSQFIQRKIEVYHENGHMTVITPNIYTGICDQPSLKVGFKSFSLIIA